MSVSSQGYAHKVEVKLLLWHCEGQGAGKDSGRQSAGKDEKDGGGKEGKEGKKRKHAEEGGLAKKVRKVNEAAHANFRKLKIRGTGAKGKGGKGRWGRRR